jgi:uncharacterized protein (TIGR01777 family)
MKNKKIIIAGGTGFIGQALAARWGKDNHVVILSRQGAGERKQKDGMSRNGDRSNDDSRNGDNRNNAYGRKLLSVEDGYNITYWRWDGRNVEKHWTNEIEGSDLVLNLAGRSVNCRYNPSTKREILESRVNSTYALGQAIREAIVPPKLWINAASATIYRHAEDRPQDEYNGEFHVDFSVQVCKIWEKFFNEQEAPFTRKIALRMAITLGEGGVMVPYLNLVKYGLGGRQGNGRQMVSWVHIEDVGRAIEWLFGHPELEGVYNVAAPGPVSNRVFMKTLREVTGHRFGLPASVWMLKIGAALIGTETELILKSRWVVPTKLLETGFTFRYEEVEGALKAIYSNLS